LTAIETLGRKLSADGDPVHMILTLRDWSPAFAGRAYAEPRGKEAIRVFLTHWTPSMCVWVGGEFDAALMAEITAARLNTILVDAVAEGLDHVGGRWVPGAMRSLLSQFEAILALDQNAAEKLIRAGAPTDTIIVTGAMEDCAPTLPCSETERAETALAIGPRPVWLAAAAQTDEWQELCHAHQIASRRTHRLLLVVVPDDLGSAQSMADKMREAGFNVALRSDQPDPADVSQIYIADTEEELGLWYRIAPITYMGGTILGGGCRDPFEAAALGSAVIYGPNVAPFQKHAARLNAAGASRLIRSGADMGAIVESLLSAAKAAELAHIAWDVTSRGANVTNRIADFIQLRLEELEH
jgi:3-deoxy-D-manno-octulosonic-acid transferase